MSTENLLSMHDYTSEAKIYWRTTFVLGAAVILLSVAQVAGLDRASLLQALVGAAIAALTGMFPVRIPGTKTSVAGAEIFVFLLLLLFGPAAATLAAACEAAAGSFRTSNRLTSRLGSPAMAGLAMYACGSTFEHMHQLLRAVGSDGTGVVFGLLLVTAGAYFATSTLLMASLISLKRGQPLRLAATLRDHTWLAMAFAASASIAGLVYITQNALGAIVLMVALPIIALFLSTLNLFFRHMEDDDRVRKERLAVAEREVTESTRHMAELKASEQRFHSAFTHAAVGMLLVSRACEIMQTNEALCEQLGRREGDLTGGSLLQIVHADDVAMLRAEINNLLHGGADSFSMELRCMHGDGSVVWVASYGALFSADGSGERCLIMQMQDMTARKRAEMKLHHIAFHDELTTLPNRSYFFQELARAVAGANRDPQCAFAVMLLDFDRFKTINDSLGHGAGDELLTLAAGRLQRCLRPTDFVARLGGDEFAILIEGLPEQEDVFSLADRIQSELQKPMRLAGTDVKVSASIGITTSALHYSNPGNVVRDADIALYRAKAQGKARYAIFDSQLHIDVADQLRTEGELRDALANDQLRVEYQPIFDLRSKRLYGFEALARWRHDEHGEVTPDRFIPLAEETGLIIPLGERILELSCGQLARWRESVPGAGTWILHINVSAVQLAQRDFGTRALQIIQAAAVPFDRITLEVTESVLIDRHKCALPNLRLLRDRGVAVSIDDFGNGYSSLSALQDLPIGQLKIDRSFVMRLADPKGEAIIGAILALGRSMDKDVVVEGIETTPQLEKLIQMGCERGQGFLLGEPLSSENAGTLGRETARVVRLANSELMAA